MIAEHAHRNRRDLISTALRGDLEARCDGDCGFPPGEWQKRRIGSSQLACRAVLVYRRGVRNVARFLWDRLSSAFDDTTKIVGISRELEAALRYYRTGVADS